MTTIASLAAVADLIGEPARAAILVTLMDGRALTAGELASAAGVSASTASGHLARMLEARLLSLEAQGRHRYFRLASPSVAATLEGLMSLSGQLDTLRPNVKRVSTGPRDAALRRARVCYDHFAGEVAVAIADSMVERGHLHLGSEGGGLTGSGIELLTRLGVRLDEGSRGGEPHPAFCRPCLDWSVRRHHIGGRLGRALFSNLIDQGWARRHREGRGVEITPLGARGLHTHFGIDVNPL